MQTRTSVARGALALSMILTLFGCGDSTAPSGDNEPAEDAGKSDSRSSDDDEEAENGSDEDDEDEDEDPAPSGRKDAGSARADAGTSTGGMRPSDASTMGDRLDGGGSSGAAADGSAMPDMPGSADAGAASESPCPSNGDPCKILPLGDSITFGIGYSGGYRVALFEKATMADQNVTFVGSVQNGPSMVAGKSFPKSNEGHSGWTIDQIAGLVPSPALDDKADIVLLMAGTNDVNLRRDLANAPKRLGALIDKLTSEDSHMLIVVAQLTPLNSNKAAVDTYNTALPAVVEERAAQGKHVVLVDMNTGFPEGGLGDGVHPNQKGYEWMAGVWYEAIKGALR